MGIEADISWYLCSPATLTKPVFYMTGFIRRRVLDQSDGGDLIKCGYVSFAVYPVYNIYPRVIDQDGNFL